jgi:hypothetical protein
MKNCLKRISPLFFVLFLSSLLRIVFLDKIPFRVDGDSSRIALDSIKDWQDKWPLLGTGWSGYSNISFHFIGLFLKVFGENIWGIRIFSATGGIFGVVAVYLLAKKLFRGKVAFYSAFFICFSFFHLIFSRIGLDVSWAVFFVPITIYLFLSDKWWVDVIAGLVLGFSQYFYPGVRIIPLLLLILLVDLLVFKKKTVWGVVKTLVLTGLGFLLVYGPMINYFFSHPAEYWARSKVVGIFQSGWFEQESQIRSFFDIIFTQVKNSFLVFWVPVKTGAYFWVFKTPYLEKIASFLFSFGLLKSFLSIKRKYQYSFLLIYFFLGVTLAGVLTVNSPTASRYAMVFPVISIFFGLGIEWLIHFVPQKIKLPVIVIILTVFVAEGLSGYWDNEFKKSFQFDTHTQIATFVGRYLENIKQNYNLYFLAEPDMYYDACPTLRFLSGREGIDFYRPIKEEREKIDLSEPYVIVIMPSRSGEIEDLKKMNPAGYEVLLANPNGEILSYLFANFPLRETNSFGK